MIFFLLNKEDGKCSCIHKECMETAKKANNFGSHPYLEIFKSQNHGCLNKIHPTISPLENMCF